jgi:hypothetical protein
VQVPGPFRARYSLQKVRNIATRILRCTRTACVAKQQRPVLVLTIGAYVAATCINHMTRWYTAVGTSYGKQADSSVDQVGRLPVVCCVKHANGSIADQCP